ncbi:hypothetical protein QUV83_00855 [Cellulomonas cellasea]|uniref:hypothetical protein n=1 Tax=Cellulomonas cellasea TaxID=43670 RepID=UPI0025A4983F|nr:hypothetical protein [Cellulomonas cellasea]MDM8083314.1 hypothetical protein [Cellulomonas cellasea]
MPVVIGDVYADYAQIELHPGDGGRIADLQKVGLVSGQFGEHAVLITPREYGTVTIDVGVLDAPAPRDPSWDTAVEFSMRTGQGPCVLGSGGTGRLDIPIPAELDVRVRYVVVDGEPASPWSDATDTQAERYLLQLWPAPMSPARTVAATTPWSQYWAFGPAAELLITELSDVPDPDRLEVVIDRALADHPDVTAHLRAGRDAYQAGVVRYAQELFRVTHQSDAYRVVRHDSDALLRLIKARVEHSG